MPIPAGNVSTVNLDATSDSPATARADLLALTQQFNSLIASANGVSGMAALDASGFLAGYARLVAAQTWTGVNTFTASTPIILSSALPLYQGRNTALALPNGLWRFHFPSSDGNVYFQKNTAAAGDFSTNTNVFYFGSAQAVFNVPVAVSSGVAAGDAVNKGQLDTKVFGGRINSTGAAISLPAGWSSVRNALGQYTVTHNFGATNYACVPVADGSSTMSTMFATGANSFTVNIITGGLFTDQFWQFVLVRT